MRKIANHGDKKLQRAQYDMLLGLLVKIDKKKEVRIVLDELLTESEKAYLSQRLDVIRMLLMNSSYEEIKNEIGAQMSTISNTKKCIENGGADFRKALVVNKLKRKKVYREVSEDVENNKIASANYPGAIKF